MPAAGLSCCTHSANSKQQLKYHGGVPGIDRRDKFIAKRDGSILQELNWRYLKWQMRKTPGALELNS
jgi:hypothetical protein